MYSVLYRKDIHVIRYPKLLNFDEILQLERNKLMYFLHCFFYKMSNTSIDFALKTDHRGIYISMYARKYGGGTQVYNIEIHQKFIFRMKQ